VYRLDTDDRLLLETDAHYLSPAPWRGKRNEQSYVVQVAEAVARARGVGIDHVAAITVRNTEHLFSLGSTP
jgi:TatD DNase family protein